MITPLYQNGNPAPNNGNGGLFISDGTQVETFCLYGLSQMAVQFGPTFTNITTNVVAPVYTGLLNSAVWFQFNDDGTTFKPFLIESRTANFTPTIMGFYAGAVDTNTAVKTWSVSWQ